VEAVNLCNPYANNKLTAWPNAWRALNAGTDCLTSVHLMPQNLCNHHCEFCSYRMPDNKNSALFNDKAHLPFSSIKPLLDHFEELGVRGIELTGGGEPLAYPHINTLLLEIKHRGFQLGLVTNGTLFEKCRDTILGLGETLSWVRVSIDAGDRDTYARMRLCPPEHWDRAWQTLQAIGDAAESFHKDFRLGASFVLSRENCHPGQVFNFVKEAWALGIDNVRLSSTFSDMGLDFFGDRQIIETEYAADKATEEFHLKDGHNGKGPNFQVHNFISTRLLESAAPHQDYERCHTKDLLCVVEGSGNVYPCCTFTGSGKHVYGNFLSHPRGFKGVWEDTQDLRQQWDARTKCKVSCLYRERNLAMIDLLDEPTPRPTNGDVIHPEFI
jgi:radical SAM protein with 4Fe4S-binding SPASM domain